MITQITKKSDYKQTKDAHFLQSFDWGEFQRSVGQVPIRLKVGDIYIQGTIKTKLKCYKEAYFAGVQLDKKTIAQVIGYLKKQKIDYIHFDVYKNSNLKTLQKTAQPAQTMILDLALSQDEMLKNMHSKTRYNIRLAQKKEVTILHKKDIQAFWHLTKVTASRNGFTSHQKKYYKQMLALPFVEQFTAYLDQEVIASNLCVNFNGTFFYLHGASLHKHKKLRASYLLQWHQILFAKDNGCKVYDFWGVAPKDDNGQKFHKYSWQKNHKWSGFTRFKAGFGGIYQETFFSKKLILSPIKYIVMWKLRLVKKLLNR